MMKSCSSVITLGLISLITILLVLSNSSSALAFPAEVSRITSRLAPPPPGTRPGRPSTPNRRPPRTCNTAKCPEAEDDIDTADGDAPTTTEADIPSPDPPEYPRPGPEAKIKKREKADPPQSPDWQRCFGERCPTSKRKYNGHTLVKQQCVHMAGREWVPRYWTCCPEDQSADINGNCCSALDGNYKCSKGTVIPLKKYSVKVVENL